MSRTHVSRFSVVHRILGIGIIVLLLIPGFVLSSQTRQDTALGVFSRGDLLCVGGSGEGNYSNIQDAIADAQDGDTIYVYDDSSPYFEHLVIDKSIILRGEEMSPPQINGSLLDSALDTILVKADFVNIHGFEITMNLGHYYQAAVKVESRNVTIKECRIMENEWVGIYLLNASFCIIKECELYNNLIAIHLVNSQNNVISETLCHENADGITLYQSSHDNQLLNIICSENRFDGILIQQSSGNHIINCVCENGYSGISLPYAPGTMMRNNTLLNNYANFGVGSSFVSDFLCDIDTSNTINGKPLYYLINQQNLAFDETTEIGFLGLILCQNISVKNQQFSHNFEGILLAGTTDSSLVNCSFQSNDGHGLYMISCQNITIQSCSFQDGFWDGVYLYDCSDNFLTNCSYQNSVTGVNLAMSTQNMIQHQIISDCTKGVSLDSSPGNILRDIRMVQCGIQVSGITAADYENDVDTSNIVNGNPVYYMINETNMSVPLDAGQVILVRCNGCIVSHCSLNNASIGLMLAYSTKSIIEDNILSDNKVVAVDLDGANNENNIIRGNLMVRNNYGVDVDASDLNLFQDNILRENGMGFSLNSCGKNTMFGNSIQNGSIGIFLLSSSENILQETLLRNMSLCGMYLYDSCKNTLDSNAMMNCSIIVQGSDMTAYQNDADTTNTVNGKPLYYLCSQQQVTIPRDAGEVILVDSKECTIKDLRLDHGTVGVLLAYSTNNTIQGNIIRNQSICGLNGLSGGNDFNLIQGNLIEGNADGIVFSFSRGNRIRKNTIRSNGGGLSLDQTVTTFVFRNTISQNNNGIVVSQANESRFLFNNIYQNYAYGLIAHACVVTARWNWWGAMTGPQPEGNGDTLWAPDKGQILSSPWLWFPVLFTGQLRYWFFQVKE
ncbi:MAG: right-handed parallel beta-helix repeat-containing protein [Candidatus Thermoplasmatota archaeon]|nr:right-handed parallel beta-helix repeat-containing protein [Candidatus Thermoplasmatota archaeon]